jgi:hypothetical protein
MYACAFEGLVFISYPTGQGLRELTFIEMFLVLKRKGE